MTKNQIVKVDPKAKPGKIKITVNGADEVACQVHYREELYFCESTDRWIYRLWYVDRIDQVLNDEPCYMCDQEENVKR